MVEEFWGYHLIVNAGGCPLELITDYENIDKFARTLVDRIDMVAYGAPQIINFGSGDKAGYTLVQLIETSNITAHFVDETHEIYLDVFSCKPFKESDVVDHVYAYFEPRQVNFEFIPRKAPGWDSGGSL